MASAREPESGSAADHADVTGNEPVELELVDLMDRYRLLVELSPDAIVVHEAGVVRYANGAAGRLARTTPKEMIGRSIVDFIHPDDLEATLLRIISLTEPGMVSVPTTLRLMSETAGPFLIESISVRTTWEGRPAYQVIMRDVAEREEAKAVLRAQAQLVESVSDAIVASDMDHRVTSWNPAAERIFGWTADEVIGQQVDFGLDDAEVAAFREKVAEGGRWSGELLAKRKDGSLVPVHTSMAALTDDMGRPGFVSVCSDQTLRHESERATARAEARFSTVVSALDEGIAVVTAAGAVQATNPALRTIFGRSEDELRAGLRTGVAFAPCGDDGEPLPAARWPLTVAVAEHRSVTDRIVGLRSGVAPAGELVWLRVNVHPLDDGDEADERSYVCSFSDITAQRRVAARLSWAASHDELTGLPNRWAMTTRIDEALGRGVGRVAVLFCDLDRFKDVNDSLGHRVGDAVLCEVADRLRRIMRPADVVGRLGGDEFLVLCTDVSSSEAVTIAEGVVAALSQPIEVTVQATTMTVALGASVGASQADVGDRQPHDVDELLQAADAALYKAKARGRNRVEVFDVRLREEARRRLDMREDLRVALEDHQLDVHFQPIFRTDADPAKCTIAGCEALVRWTHPTRGPQAPAEFVPIAEDSGLISMLGLFVLEQACAQTVAWRGAGHPDLHVSVNLSARQLSERDLVASVVGVLDRTGLPAAGLWLELTESALAEEGLDAVGVLDELVGLGVRISIDDFGTGYSSLGRLRRYPVSALKVDQSFVADMTAMSAADGFGDGGAIVESTISLAHRLGLSVVAEGVETIEQLQGLARAHCDFSQGYLLARPAAAGDVTL